MITLLKYVTNVNINFNQKTKLYNYGQILSDKNPNTHNTFSQLSIYLLIICIYLFVIYSVDLETSPDMLHSC